MSSIAASSAGSTLGQSTSISGGISFAGLGSGTDFQSMIDQLKKVEEIPKNRLELWRNDWQKRVDAFDELLEGITTLSKKLSGMDSMATFLTKVVGTTNSNAITAVASSNAPLGSYKINVAQLATNALLTTKDPVVPSKDQVIAPTQGTFTYTYAGTARTLTIPQGTSMQSFVNIVNNDTRNPGVKASLIKSGAGYVFQLQGKDTGAVNALEVNSTDLSVFGDPLNDWYDRKAQDAKFYLEGRSEQILSSASNSLTEVIPGLTITLTNITDDLDTNGNIVTPHSVMLTVTNDAASAKQKVVDFVDGVNELLAKFQELTKYDKSKKVVDATKSASQFDAEKGSVLTGNYGVQLLNTKIKSMCVSTAQGFLPLGKDGTGDVFWSLATIGISMDADETSKTFGQLVIKEGESEKDSPFKTLDEALAQDPEAVAELLAGDKLVRGNSPDFSYVGMLSKDMVKGGTHDVKYWVQDDGGGPYVSKMLIDGVEASYDMTSGEWTSNAANSKGLVIRADNLNVGEHSGTLSVKQGKINELNEMFKSELKGANLQLGKQTNEKGSLHVLRENYLDIIKNIDKKIEQEETRLILWETRMRLQFSRLDTLLSNYNSQMASNAAALNSASSNYSGSST